MTALALVAAGLLIGSFASGVTAGWRNEEYGKDERAASLIWLLASFGWTVAAQFLACRQFSIPGKIVLGLCCCWIVFPLVGSLAFRCFRGNNGES